MITVELKDTKGERSGIPRLTLIFSVANKATVPLAIANLTAVIRVTKEMTCTPSLREAYFIGTGFLESGDRQLSPNSSNGRWHIVIPLTPYQLQKVEEMRNGKALFLNVEFLCVVGWLTSAPSPTITTLTGVAVNVAEYSEPYCPFRVPQSDWVKILKDLGYGDYFLMEIPLKGVPDRRGMQKAVEHLKAAWEHFEQGNDDETLVSCYKAFEYLAKKYKCEHPDQNAFEKILSDIPEMEKRRRLKMLMHDLCQFLTLGRHERGTEATMLDERDSEYGLVLSQATLSYLAKLMRETVAK